MRTWTRVSKFYHKESNQLIYNQFAPRQLAHALNGPIWNKLKSDSKSSTAAIEQKPTKCPAMASIFLTVPLPSTISNCDIDPLFATQPPWLAHRTTQSPPQFQIGPHSRGSQLICRNNWAKARQTAVGGLDFSDRPSPIHHKNELRHWSFFRNSPTVVHPLHHAAAHLDSK